MTLTRFIRRLTGKSSEPQRVNRSVLILRPKEPFHRWISEVSGITQAQARAATAKDQTGYLLPVSGESEPDREALNHAFRTLFEQELRDWCEDDKRWPQPRSRAMFNQWFDFTYCDLVLDLDDGPLEQELWDG